MTITKNQNGSALEISLKGRLDTVTAPDLEKEFHEVLPGVEKLTLDMDALEYISSAGLRVLLTAQKVMNKQGEMKLIHVNETIMEILEVTGFLDIMNVE